MRHPTRLRRTFAVIKRGLACLAARVFAYGLLLLYPQPMFGYRTVYGSYRVWSDQPILQQIRTVLDDVTRRLRTSAVHDASVPVDIFICDAPWRMWRYDMVFSTRYGGETDWFCSTISVFRARSPGTITTTIFT
jgi:hypothetical protein